MFCPNCGTEVGGNEKFCPNCGTELDQSSRISNNSSTGVVNANTSQPYYQNVSGTGTMGIQATSIVAYMTWIGFLVAYLAGDKEGAKFYMNQALVFHLFSLLCFVPFIGWLWAIYMLICFILGVIWAAEQESKELPLIGQIKLLN